MATADVAQQHISMSTFTSWGTVDTLTRVILLRNANTSGITLEGKNRTSESWVKAIKENGLRPSNVTGANGNTSSTKKMTTTTVIGASTTPHTVRGHGNVTHEKNNARAAHHRAERLTRHLSHFVVLVKHHTSRKQQRERRKIPS
jgi:hypothetical protein